MLSRVAESLYWIGRYVERAEHCSRFLEVQYFSSLDMTMLDKKDFNLRSIMFMAGSEAGLTTQLEEKEVWKNVIFDVHNGNSIYSTIKFARENARSIRNSISMEIWESINRLFLFRKKYNVETFASGNIYAFSEDMKSHIAVIKSNVTNTLLHDDIYNFIALGFYVERAFQILRITRNKISDWTILSNNGENTPLKTFQWTILLKALEAYDVHNKFYKGKKTSDNIFKLIFENALFPRSIAFSMERIRHSIVRFSIKPYGYEAFLVFLEEEFAQCIKSQDFENEDEVINHIDKSYNCISKLHKEINSIYFN